MTEGRGRPWRTSEQSFPRPGAPRAALSALLALAALSLAIAAAPAAAMTGGAAAQPAPSEEAIARSSFTKLRTAKATWYGPGLYGNRTACGQVLRPSTIGVAHRALPCGTPVLFTHRGRSIVAPVIDRGPFAFGIRWDLTNGVRLLLGFRGSGPIRYAIAREAAVAMRLRRAARRGS